MRNLIEAVIKLSGGPTSAESPVQKMLAAYRDLTHDHPLDPRSRIYGNASIELSPSVNDRNNCIHISDIMSLEVGKRNGSMALKMICDLADEYGVDLELTAKAYGKAYMSSTQLVDWYSRYGFVQQYDDFEIDDEYIEEEGLEMIRRARNKVLKLSGKMRTIDFE